MNTIRIIGLAAITLLSLVPLAKPAPPTLRIQFSSQPISFSSWSSAMVFSSSSSFTCGNGLTIPGTVVINGLNFTENLSGRDPGSTWIHFRSLNGGPAIFTKADVTSSLITDFLCQGFTVSLNREKVLLGTDSYWRVESSGNYTMISSYIFFTTPPSTPTLSELANETWTVTKIL